MLFAKIVSDNLNGFLQDCKTAYDNFCIDGSTCEAIADGVVSFMVVVVLADTLAKLS